MDMTHKNVFQMDPAGMLLGTTIADPSPLEPDVWLIPAGCVEVPPPPTSPDDKWPRWNGSAWDLVTKPPAPDAANPDPVAKLRAFLADNPDVAGLIGMQ